MTAIVLAYLARAWTFLKTPLGQITALVFAGVLSLATAYGVGHHNGVMKERRAEAARAAKAAKVVARHEVVAAKISTDIATRTEQTRVQIQWRTRTLIEKVPTYVPAAADAGCSIPVGFVRLHDAAAAGVSAPAGGPDETASSVPLSAVASTVVANYGVAYDWRAEAMAWRAWYQAQSAAWVHR